MRRFLVACAGVWLLSCLTARAQGLAIELSPFYGYRFGGSIDSSTGDDLDFDAGQAYGLALDFGPRDSDMKFELLWSHQESGIDFEGLGGLDSLDVTVDEFMFGGIYEMGQGKFREYFTGMVGASLFDVPGSDPEAYFCIGIGGGVKYYVHKNLALRLDLRGYCNIVESEGAFISSGGYTVAYFSADTLWQGEVSVGVTLSF